MRGSHLYGKERYEDFKGTEYWSDVVLLPKTDNINRNLTILNVPMTLLTYKLTWSP